MRPGNQGRNEGPKSKNQRARRVPTRRPAEESVDELRVGDRTINHRIFKAARALPQPGTALAAGGAVDQPGAASIVAKMSPEAIRDAIEQLSPDYQEEFGFSTLSFQIGQDYVGKRLTVNTVAGADLQRCVAYKHHCNSVGDSQFRFDLATAPIDDYDMSSRILDELLFRIQRDDELTSVILNFSVHPAALLQFIYQLNNFLKARPARNLDVEHCFAMLHVFEDGKINPRYFNGRVPKHRSRDADYCWLEFSDQMRLELLNMAPNLTMDISNKHPHNPQTFANVEPADWRRALQIDGGDTTEYDTDSDSEAGWGASSGAESEAEEVIAPVYVSPVSFEFRGDIFSQNCVMHVSSSSDQPIELSQSIMESVVRSFSNMTSVVKIVLNGNVKSEPLMDCIMRLNSIIWYAPTRCCEIVINDMSQHDVGIIPEAVDELRNLIRAKQPEISQKMGICIKGIDAGDVDEMYELHQRVYPAGYLHPKFKSTVPVEVNASQGRPPLMGVEALVHQIWRTPSSRSALPYAQTPDQPGRDEARSAVARLF